MDPETRHLLPIARAMMEHIRDNERFLTPIAMGRPVEIGRASHDALTVKEIRDELREWLRQLLNVVPDWEHGEAMAMLDRTEEPVSLLRDTDGNT